MKKLLFCYVMDAHIEQRKREIALIDCICLFLDIMPYILALHLTTQDKTIYTK